MSPNRGKKLVLVVIDALKPSMLERAIATGRAPALARIRDEGVYVDDCVAAFPSVTPVCAATITTGAGPDAHRIPSGQGPQNSTGGVLLLNDVIAGQPAIFFDQRNRRRGPLRFAQEL